jgi:uncharacterized protein YbjQ (UPF0145 family)
MIVTTTENVPGRRTVRTLGLVRGSTIRARHIGSDIQASLRNLFGGEVVEYTKLIAESREQAIDRAIAEAERLGADAIVAFRLTSSEVARGAAEILAYGTAVVLEPEK